MSNAVFLVQNEARDNTVYCSSISLTASTLRLSFHAPKPNATIIWRCVNIMENSNRSVANVEGQSVSRFPVQESDERNRGWNIHFSANRLHNVLIFSQIRQTYFNKFAKILQRWTSSNYSFFCNDDITGERIRWKNRRKFWKRNCGVGSVMK